MFAKSGIGELASAIESEFASFNVANAKAVTQRILVKALPHYSNGLIETAHALLQKPDVAIASLSEQIEEMDAVVVNFARPEMAAVNEDEEDNILTAKLSKPARISETASDTTQTNPRRFAGLFSR